MRESLKRWPWYAAVLAAYPLLYIAVTNPGQVAAADVMPVVAAGILGCRAAGRPREAVRRQLGGGRARRGLGHPPFLSIRAGQRVVARLGAQRSRAAGGGADLVPRLSATRAFGCLGPALRSRGIARLRRIAARIPPAATGGLNVVAAVLLAFLGIQAIANVTRAGDSAAARPTVGTLASAQVPTTAAGPDIYFIVLDGYARADVLAKYYGFDNGPFLEGLRQRGFQVSEASRSNFYWTFLSIGSSLNLDYIQALVGGGSRPGQPRPDGALSDPARQPRVAIPARAWLSLRAPAIHLGRDGQQSVCGRIPALSRGPVRQRVSARGRGCVLAACARVEGEPRHRELPPAELRNAGGAGAGARPQVRVRPLRAAAPPVSLRSRRHGASPRDDLGPVRVPEAALGGPRGVRRPARVRESPHRRGRRPPDRRLGRDARDHSHLGPRSEPEGRDVCVASSATSGCRT